MLSATVNAKLFGHASIDATAIDARKKPVLKPKQALAPKSKGKRGCRHGSWLNVAEIELSILTRQLK
jgi:hypothetical protein